MLLYFAYGSNMLPLRIEERIGACQVIGTARLPGHRLMFHKRGRDGSGKCDAHHTGDPRHVVHGVLYQVHPGQKLELDRWEGVGRGYEVATVIVCAEQADHEAVVYRAQPSHIDPAVRPFSWYHALVVHGARHHGLPRDYVDAIAAIAPVEDPDARRRNRYMKLLPGHTPEPRR